MTIADPIPLLPQDLTRLEDEPGVEFSNGQITEKTVSVESVRIGGKIYRLLADCCDNTRDGEAFPATLGYRYPEGPLKFRNPDVSVITAERVKQVTPDQGFIQIPADLVVEVISPNDNSYDVDEKTAEYLTNGVRIVWEVDPNTKTVNIYRADGSVTSASSAFNFRIQRLQFSAGVLDAKLPVDASLFFIAAGCPG